MWLLLWKVFNLKSEITDWNPIRLSTVGRRDNESRERLRSGRLEESKP